MDGEPRDVTPHETSQNGGVRSARRRALAVLVTRREKLSPEDAKLFRSLFPEIMRAHQDTVWDQLRKRALLPEDVKEISQETFLTFFSKTLKLGFPDNVAAMLNAIAYGKFLNFLHRKKRTPLSVALPPSSAEKPRSSGFDVERAIDLKVLHEKVLPQLPPQQRAALEAVELHGLTHRDAALLLDVTEGKLKVLLEAGKELFERLVRRYMPASQRVGR